MHTKTFFALTAALALCSGLCSGSEASRGLWVGEVTLNAVNEAVAGINTANQTVATDPGVTTPVKSPASLRIILHVDDAGQARLLKNVAIVARTTNTPSDVILLTDPTLYGNYTDVGRRITAVAYDFGDEHAVDLLDRIAASAANAAANGENPTNAASQVAQNADPDLPYLAFVRGNSMNSAALGAALSARIAALSRKSAGGSAVEVVSDARSAATNDARVAAARATALSLETAAVFPDTRYTAAVDSVALAAAAGAASAANSNMTAQIVGECATNSALLALTNAAKTASIVSPEYKSFIASTTLGSSVNLAANAAASAVRTARSGASATEKITLANAAAIKALMDGQIYAAADRATMNEAVLTGSVRPGATVQGRLYLGANHPTNPFRHRRHPDHTTGFPITRELRMTFDANSTNAYQNAGFGVDKLTGTYREEISGLHKPLGAPLRNLGLITEGTITLNRISLTGALNQ